MLVDDVGTVRVLTMNRPEARNALDDVLMGALYDALIAADQSPRVDAVVLTGADPAFCAGIDLKQAAREGQDYFDRHQATPTIPQVALMATPVIGAINGPAITGGLEMALGCDLLIASERAAFADTHARVGVLPGGGITVRLPALVGDAWARRLSFTGELIDAATALRIGLVTEMVPHEMLMSRAVELATAIAETPAATMLELKRVYVDGAMTTRREALAIEKATSASHRPDTSMIESRRLAVSERNRRQLREER